MKKYSRILLLTLMIAVIAISFVGCATVYTVTFDTRGGGEVKPLKKVAENSLIIAPEAPSKTDFKFAGWYQDENCEKAWIFATDKVASDLTLYAKWLDVTYTVKFDSLGGSGVSSAKDVAKGALIAEPTVPTLANCKFLGWYKDAKYEEVWNFATDKVFRDVTLYAKWEPKDTVVELAIKQPADKIQFVIGDNFSSKGLEVESIRKDGIRLLLNPTEYTIDYSKFDSYTEGFYDINIVFNLDSAVKISYQINVRTAKTVASIAVDSTSHQQKDYLIEDRLNLNGLVIRKTYDDGTSEIATPEEFFPQYINMRVAGKFNVEIIFDAEDSITTTYPISIYDPAKLAPTSIFIANLPIRTTFVIGEALNTAGLSIVKNVALFGDRDIKIGANEFTINQDAYDNALVGSYSIVIESRSMPSLTAEYTVAVKSVEGATIKEIRIKDATHQTVFYKDESFNNDNIVVEKIMSNGVSTNLLPQEFTVDSTLYKMNEIGFHTIKITLNGEPTIFTEYTVRVEKPLFVGKYYLESREASACFQILMLVIKEDNAYYMIDHDTNTIEPIGRKFDISKIDGQYFLEAGPESYMFNPITKELMNGEGMMLQQMKDDEIVLQVKSGTKFIYNMIVKKGGCIGQKYLEAYSMFGMLYKTDAMTDLITTTTIFNEEQVIFVKSEAKDYTGKPFVAKYAMSTDPKKILDFKANGVVSVMEGGACYESPYVAVKSGANWEIHVLFDRYVYNTTSNILVKEYESYNKIDPAKQVVVTITDTAGTTIVAQYLLNKGEKFTGLYIQYYSDEFIKWVLKGYAGEAINADVTYAMESKIVAKGYYFGTYGTMENKRFTIDSSYGFNSVIHGSTAWLTYTIVDVTADSVTINLPTAFSSENIVVTPTSMTITSGDHKGVYNKL